MRGCVPIAWVALPFADDPPSATFGPDDTHLYIGTVLGHLDSHSIEGLVADAGEPMLQPNDSVNVGFPIIQITPGRDGSRLWLTDLNSDRIFVVQ